MNQNQDNKKKYCVYLTMYTGKLIPRWYIGSSFKEKVLIGYHGSVRSKKWKTLYENELKDNNHLFTSRILSYYDTYKEAITEELRLQKLHKVVKNKKYFNESYASVNGCFGRDVSGKLHPLFGVPVNPQRKEKQIKSITTPDENGITPAERGGKKCSSTKLSPKWKNTKGRLQKKKWKQSMHIKNENNLTPTELQGIKYTDNNPQKEYETTYKTLYQIFDTSGELFYESQKSRIQIADELKIPIGIFNSSINGTLFEKTRKSDINRYGKEYNISYNKYKNFTINAISQPASKLTNHKFIEEFDVSDYEVLSDTGFVEILNSNKTIEYEVYEIKMDNGDTLRCADTHILINMQKQEIFAKYSLNERIKVKNGKESKVVSVNNLGYSENMYDISVNSKEHTYYTNNILSHNTVTSGNYLLWRALFHLDPINIGIVANKPSTAVEVLSKIKKTSIELPIWMQRGISIWNQGSIEFENGTRIMTDGPSSDSFRGYTINIIYLDELAYFKKSLWDEFSDSVFPTMNSLVFKQVIMTSTANGMNHFSKLCHSAESPDTPERFITTSWENVPHYSKQGKQLDPETYKKLTIKRFGKKYFAQTEECVGGDTIINTLEYGDCSMEELFNKDIYDL